MRQLWSRIRGKLTGEDDFEVPEEQGKDYVELDSEPSGEKRAKIVVRPFVLEEFADIKPVLDALREGYTIALVNIRPLKERDLVELKRAVNKLKKTCETVEGDIAGFGEDWVAITPSFAGVYRNQPARAPQVDHLEKF